MSLKLIILFVSYLFFMGKVGLRRINIIGNWNRCRLLCCCSSPATGLVG